MRQQLSFHGKPIAITLSDAAAAQSQKMSDPLLMEIQIYFSCVLVKRAAIYSATPQKGAWQLGQEEFDALLGSAQSVSGKLLLRFNTVMTKVCPVADYLGPPPVSDFEIVRKEAFVPHWLKIDYVNDEWVGDYGWHESNEPGLSTVQIRGAAIRSHAT
ncbi:MAG: hypothetical protein OEZ16_05670 [Chromatiales bacterium]|nr:hypothetical protein [Chromatiales bacterium]